MARFANLKNRTPAPRIKVKVIETGRNALGSYSIYQDDRGRQATLTTGMEDENDTIPLLVFVSALKEAEEKELRDLRREYRDLKSFNEWLLSKVEDHVALDWNESVAQRIEDEHMRQGSS